MGASRSLQLEVGQMGPSSGCPRWKSGLRVRYDLGSWCHVYRSSEESPSDRCFRMEVYRPRTRMSEYQCSKCQWSDRRNYDQPFLEASSLRFHTWSCVCHQDCAYSSQSLTTWWCHCSSRDSLAWCLCEWSASSEGILQLAWLARCSQLFFARQTGDLESFGAPWTVHHQQRTQGWDRFSSRPRRNHRVCKCCHVSDEIRFRSLFLVGARLCSSPNAFWWGLSELRWTSISFLLQGTHDQIFLDPLAFRFRSHQCSTLWLWKPWAS